MCDARVSMQRVFVVFRRHVRHLLTTKHSFHGGVGPHRALPNGGEHVGGRSIMGL